MSQSGQTQRPTRPMSARPRRSSGGRLSAGKRRIRPTSARVKQRQDPSPSSNVDHTQNDSEPLVDLLVQPNVDKSSHSIRNDENSTQGWMPGSQLIPVSEEKRKGVGAPFSTQVTANVNILHLRNERMRTEKDRQKLRNRILRLRTQEKQARKAIINMHQKGLKVAAFRRRRDRERSQLAANIQNQEEQRRKRTQYLRQTGKNRKRAFRLYQREVQSAKREQAIRDKEAKLIQSKMRQVAKERRRLNNVWLRNNIRTRQKEAALRRQRQKLYDMARAEEQREARVFLEAQRAQEAAADIRDMQREERELLERLQTTQNYQNQAFDQLESILQSEKLPIRIPRPR